MFLEEGSVFCLRSAQGKYAQVWVCSLTNLIFLSIVALMSDYLVSFRALFVYK